MQIVLAGHAGWNVQQGLDRRLKDRLTREITGDVLFDPFNRGRYATDASFYQIVPAGVVVPAQHRRSAAGAGDRPRRRADRHAARRRHLAMRPDHQ